MQSDFLYLVEDELVDGRESDSALIHSGHEAYGLICDHAARLLDEIQAPSLDSQAGLLRRLVEIAAMCYRAAEDLQLVEFEPEPEYVTPSEAELDRALDILCDHKGLRFRADDPNREKLGMSRNHKCLHGVEWTITGPCLDALSTEQFPTHCDCSKDDPNLNVCPRCGSMADKSLRVICACPIG